MARTSQTDLPATLEPSSSSLETLHRKPHNRRVLKDSLSSARIGVADTSMLLAHLLLKVSRTLLAGHKKIKSEGNYSTRSRVIASDSPHAREIRLVSPQETLSIDSISGSDAQMSRRTSRSNSSSSQAQWVTERGSRTYSDIAKELEGQFPDCFVAIEPDSGQYIVGRDRSAAMEKYSAKFGSAPGYLRKIGALTDVGRI